MSASDGRGDDADAGVDVPDNGGDDDDRTACGCDSQEVRGGQWIHVCSGSFDPAVCEQLTCDGRAALPAPCSPDRVRLCCEMPALDLYTNLYEDCEHDNCEDGFRRQCASFGGHVSSGLCGGQEPPAEEDDTRPSALERAKGLCTVAGTPGGEGGPLPGWTLGLLLGLWALRRSRRRVMSTPAPRG